MQSVSYSYVETDKKNSIARNIEGKFQDVQRKNYNWKLSYALLDSSQQNVALQYKSSYILCSYKDKLHNVCPADIKMFKQYIYEKPESKDDDLEPRDLDHDEHETHLGSRPSDTDLEQRKLTTWEEYKKLVELSRSNPKMPSISKSLLHVTSQERFRIHSKYFKLKAFKIVKKSIIKAEQYTNIFTVDTNYVQFRNFKPRKVYKKTVTLQNVSNRPARFNIEGRPYRSNFRVIVKPMQGNIDIISPGVQTRLIVVFCSSEIDDSEEILVINVQNGRPLLVRLHGFRDPPILLGIWLSADICNSDSDTTESTLVPPWQPEMSTSFDTVNELYGHKSNHEETSVTSTESIAGESSWDSDSSEHGDDFVSPTFDCSRCFIGEVIQNPLNLKIVSGEGRFFIMSESDWFTMDIADVTESNILKLPCFTLQPAYFSLKANDEINFYMNFSPKCYGMHVEKLYILCDNGRLVATEIIGDGLLYEPNFIRFNKEMDKKWTQKMSIDKRANYYVNLSTSVPDGIAQCIISTSNISETCMHFHWKKRKVQAENPNINEENDFPLELLHIKPDQGVFKSTSVHHFTVTAEYQNLQPNYYSAILQLYVEDIPIESIPESQEFVTEECTTKRRHCASSVDVWVADVEVSLQYLMDDGNGTDTTSEELLKCITQTQSDYEYHEEDYCKEEEPTMEEMQQFQEPMSICPLVEDELFSHYDLFNLTQFEPLWRERIISMGIIRPTRCLHIGIEETYILMLKNLAGNALDYSWGEVGGLDSTKLKLCVCPEKGEISAGKTQKMEITFVPIEEGIVVSLFIPCFVGDSRKIIMLGIECAIEPLYVMFYFPLSDTEPLVLKNNFLRVEWRVNSLQRAFDMAGKSKRHMKLLDKYRIREEEELTSTNLDQGEVLEDVSAGPSMLEEAAEELEEQSSTSIRTFEIIRMSNLIPETEKYSQNADESVVPFFETFFPPPTQPVVIEFLKLPLRSMKKKTFIIKNETAIPTNFSLSVKNFYPVTCSCEWKSQEEKIKFIYKRTFGRHKKLIEETLCRVKKPDAGVVIYVDPLNSDIGAFKAVPVDIYVFADTWGIYVDELEINISGLPQYTVGICVQAIGSPISLSISDKTESSTPVIKYGIRALGTSMEDRRILLKNTSVVPVAIDWHTFLVKPTIETLPFNVAINLCTPLTDDLAAKLKGSKQRSDSELHLKKHANAQAKARDLHTCDSTETSDIIDCTDITVSSTYLGSPGTAMSCKSADKTSSNTEISSDRTNRSCESSLNCDNTYTIEQSDGEEKHDVELNIFVLPYYGTMDTKILTVTPREMFILPKSTASLIIAIHLDRYKIISKTEELLEGEFLCKILGFLRIAPSDMYRDNWYARQTGNYYPPIEINITASIIKAKLQFNISKYDRTFVCSASDVIQSKRKAIELSKTFILDNNENSHVEISLETYDPFHIKTVALHTETNPCKPGTMCINPYASAEIEVICIVRAELIKTTIHTTSSQELKDSKIVLREPLYIMHADKQYQVIELILHIWLPILKLSSHTLDFGTVYIGDTKKLTLNIEDLSTSRLKFKVNNKLDNKDFAIDKEDGILSSHYNNEDWTFAVTVSFQPKLPGPSIETLEIITDISYYTEECQLYGEGTLDEKYHTSGV